MRSPFRERLPESLTLMQVALQFGLDASSFNGTHYRCPFHNDDKTPNLRLWKPDTRDGSFYCFRCEAGRDLVDWVGRARSLSNLEAYRLLREHFGLGSDDLLAADSGVPAEHGNVIIHRLACLKDAEIEELARPRNWNADALRCAQFWNELRMIQKYKGKRVYVLMDPYKRIAVVRPFDGSLWDGKKKGLLARGSNPGIPVGIHLIGRHQEVLITEGVPDYLRVLSLLYEHGKHQEILPLMMATATVHMYEGVLSAFRLKRVRIVAQNDECGLAGAERWRRELVNAGAKVDVWEAPKVPIGNGFYTKDIDEIYVKSAGKDHLVDQHLNELFNLDRRLSTRSG
jgi:hypothetical protein